MTKGSFVEMNCPIAQTLEQVGEWWTFVIVRDAFCGVTRFQDFQRHLGISTNVLTRRLGRLVDNGIFTREPSTTDARVVHYRLTPKGYSLYPVLAAMTLWGEKWVPHDDGARLTMVERATGLPVQGVRIVSADGRVLTPEEIETVAGPAASDSTHALMRMREETNNNDQ
ncbi:winged helix-turn-helix transcriptional regulator [Pseudoduganella chitinolytica]|uniref:Helix-turn-helix domain-containing protein n=1 Tax=Pseudoduganella chitinolytica TaxID=34070 RepID=A0ABY8BI72_9BURK|nr:helix-turn-helix domain-containing protein [Pseudoduganella chitinolytica]WEF34626.1 helix-turn-helix domain-containing protein [Pseudoduganella chitinolytica]